MRVTIIASGVAALALGW